MYFLQDEKWVITPLNQMLWTKAVSHNKWQAQSVESRQGQTDGEILERYKHAHFESTCIKNRAGMFIEALTHREKIWLKIPNDLH